MAKISAALVKELRERTGSGMMECKKALQETQGDIEAAIESMRKSGMTKADKKAGRTAAEGLIRVVQSADSVAMVELNCETDFVAKHEDFQGFADRLAHLVIDHQPADVAALSALAVDGDVSVDQHRRELIAKIGENIAIRRFVRLTADNSVLGHYLHGHRIGVLVEIEGGDEALAKDIAMHVAASNPICVDVGQVPQELLDKEREIFSAQAEQSGKPANIISKMVEGRIAKYLKEVTLVGQPFVKDPDQTVEKLLKSRSARVKGFHRFELGEGIEKKADDFVSEVMAQARGN